MSCPIRAGPAYAELLATIYFCCLFCIFILLVFLCVVTVELKNGETYNGHLVNCDTWMNIHLREVICTSKDGDRFWRMHECYIHGNTIKYLQVPDEVFDKVQEETKSRAALTVSSISDASINSNA
ncbi:probable U6 snRNA-associated Sm-like protein LSm4 [Camellia sinensis]|uniref:probable U6 snRNA-associated Sm-like protein LSm4 n=1 Tax=Camellia sinensis TaxID=4442 RepID=UPI001035C433|nr:probable U6 snRNA-associated Sm-like protein LSm4 [Camellia sinensis]